MSEYVIITDTSADIPASVLDKGQIHLIPMVYQLNGEEHPHKDPGSWDSKAFYDQLRNGGIGSIGFMLYDFDYSDPQNITPLYFRAKMEHGVIQVAGCEVFR